MRQQDVAKILTKAACTVPEAAALLGLSRNAGYEAAKTGDLPVIKFGRRLVVPTAALKRMLQLEGNESARAAGAGHGQTA